MDVVYMLKRQKAGFSMVLAVKCVCLRHTFYNCYDLLTNCIFYLKLDKFLVLFLYSIDCISRYYHFRFEKTIAHTIVLRRLLLILSFLKYVEFYYNLKLEVNWCIIDFYQSSLEFKCYFFLVQLWYRQNLFIIYSFQKKLAVNAQK